MSQQKADKMIRRLRAYARQSGKTMMNQMITITSMAESMEEVFKTVLENRLMQCLSDEDWYKAKKVIQELSNNRKHNLYNVIFVIQAPFEDCLETLKSCDWNESKALKILSHEGFKCRVDPLNMDEEVAQGRMYSVTLSQESSSSRVGLVFDAPEEIIDRLVKQTRSKAGDLKEVGKRMDALGYRRWRKN